MRKAGYGLSIALIGAATLLPYLAGFPGAYLEMILTLLLLGWLAGARPPIEVGAESWCLIAAVALLAAVFAINGTIAYTANFLMLILVVPLTAALRTQAAPGNVNLVARLALVGVAIPAAVASFQVAVEGRGRAAGWGSDEIWSAVGATVLGWLALMGRFGATGLWRHLYLLGPVLGTLVVLLSGSRGPMLAIPLMFGVAFAMMPGHRLGLVVSALAVLALFVFWPDKSRMISIATIGKEIAAGVPLSDGSSDVRKLLLDAGWAAFKLSPWTGYGWSHFAEATSTWTGIENWVDRPDAFHLHSDPLNFAV
ncbi:MAG TPA: O-antigen ligase family protein, partial [Devosia sp.]